MWLAECQPCDEEKKSKRKFQKGADHNLDQARGAIRLWKRHVIAGRNAWHRFWLPWEQCPRAVVLSVVKTGAETLSLPTGNGFVEIHADWAKQQGVALCATVPQFLVDGLASMGGSTLDLLIMLNYLRHDGVVPEQRVIAILRDYRERCYRLGNGLKLAEHGLSEVDERSGALFSVVFLTLTQTRHRPTRNEGRGCSDGFNRECRG